MEKDTSNKLIWTRVAQVAGAFVFIISILLIVNYAQYNSIDPVETELINALVDRLNQNPDDEQLREQVRTVDLLSRKAYFTNQWQVRTGGYLLLLFIGVLVLSMQMIGANSDKQVVLSDGTSHFKEQKNARKWISISGGILVIIALVTAYLTHSELGKFPVLKQETAIIEQPEENEVEIIESDNIDTSTINKQAANNEPIASNEIEVKTSEKITEDSDKVIATPDINKEEEKPSTKDTQTVKKKTTNYPTAEEINKNHPSFRGPGGNGISFHSNIPITWNGETGENIVWKLKIPIHGYNSPIIWDDKVFVSGANDNKREVYCIDRFKGNILWTVDVTGVDGSPEKSPKVTDDTGLAAPTLTTDGNSIFAIFGNGDVIAIDMEGNPLWSRNLGNTGNHYGHSSSLYVYENVLILQYDIKKSPKLLGLSTKTGETIWSTDRNVKVSWASPVVVNTGSQYEVILAADPIVASYNPLTGKENWQIDCIFGEVGPSVAYADKVVYAVNEYAILVAIQIGDKPEILWESDEYLSDVPSPVATKDFLFMATSYGAMACYDAKTGEIYWEHEFDNGFYSSPMLADGKIYLMDMQGIMHIFKAEKTFELVAESPIGENCMTTPAFSDGMIYIRGNKHLFCIGK